MGAEIKEHLKSPRKATPRGPELDNIAERLLSELPEACKGCGLAESLGCTLVAGEWWIPQTPMSARFRVDIGRYSHYRMSSWAEYALRDVVKSSNENENPGPKGDGTVCCIETRDIKSAVYTD